MSTEKITRAARVLRNSGDGPMRAMYLLACMPFDFEAFAEWIEQHPGDLRAARVSADICQYEDMLHTQYLRQAEGVQADTP